MLCHQHGVGDRGPLHQHATIGSGLRGAMDASTLSALIDASSQELAALHARLGCAPDALERAMAALKTCIHDAIRAHVAEAEADVARAQESCAAHEEAIAQLCAATGGEPALVPEMPLLARCEALVADRARLERTYTAQAEQCDLVLSQVRTLNACMSAAGGSCPEAEVAASGSLRDVTPAALSRLEAHLQHVQQVYTERKMQMEAQLSEVLQLWAETHTMPHVAMHAGRASVAAERVDESRFHLAILQYTQQVPDMADGVFRGEFLMSDDAPAELLQPTNDVLQRCATLIDTLAREKTQRESQIQTYYDELCELWVRLGATDEEMDAFVLEHRGSTLDVVEAYRAELERMRELKASNMGSFIRSTREAIWELWDRLYVSEDERQSTFPAFFVELPEHAADAAPFDWDHVLEQHEQMCAELAAAHEQRLPLLDLMERYRAICDDERALNESAHDAARLLGRGNRGDPGRLLREEKMRKRVKAQKPRVRALYAC